MVKFLNHSEVSFVDVMGDDLSVVNAARVSFDKTSYYEEGFDPQLPDKDKKLLKYLADHNHWSPFAHCFLTVRIKAPIFVARQLVKHQVGLSWNEVSRRYVDTEPEFYIPDILHNRPDGSIKQGSSEEPHKKSQLYTDVLSVQSSGALAIYLRLIEEGVSPEEARMVLPLNTMTEWIWSGSLMAFARVCNLRLDSHAQGATREVAEEIYRLLEFYFPESTKVLIKNNDKNASLAT